MYKVRLIRINETISFNKATKITCGLTQSDLKSSGETPMYRKKDTKKPFDEGSIYLMIQFYCNSVN